MTDAICRQGLRSTALKRPMKTVPIKKHVRMSLASLFEGWRWQTRSGAVHGFAGPLGGMLHAAWALCPLPPRVMEAISKPRKTPACNPR
jgi:hypothetical protein